MKFLIDENLPISLKKELSKNGYEVIDIREIGKIGISDEEIIKIAFDFNCILISANYKHFANIILFPPSKHHGIIVVKMPKCPIQKVIERIVNVINHIKKEEIEHSIIIIEPNRIRRRK